LTTVVVVVDIVVAGDSVAVEEAVVIVVAGFVRPTIVFVGSFLLNVETPECPSHGRRELRLDLRTRLACLSRFACLPRLDDCIQPIRIHTRSNLKLLIQGSGARFTELFKSNS
jgi:hypothetical protein